MTTERSDAHEGHSLSGLSSPEDGGGGDGAGGSARFTRRVEDFTCEHCGRAVRGNGYTNHCPYCLHSKHVDVNPGDRAATCGGLMVPVAAGIRRDQYFVVQHCRRCGHLHRNRTAPRDDRAAILALFGRPIPSPSRIRR